MSFGTLVHVHKMATIHRQSGSSGSCSIIRRMIVASSVTGSSSSSSRSIRTVACATNTTPGSSSLILNTNHTKKSNDNNHFHYSYHYVSVTGSRSFNSINNQSNIIKINSKEYEFQRRFTSSVGITNPPPPTETTTLPPPVTDDDLVIEGSEARKEEEEVIEETTTTPIVPPEQPSVIEITGNVNEEVIVDTPPFVPNFTINPPPPQQQQQQPVVVDWELNLSPSEVVAGLDLHIVGQQNAKRAVAIAMRNRWRRKQLPDELRKEITPRNVLLVGPTGCGKTEVARRMAKLNNSPFIKVEATKFTEVGYHGRDVDQIIRDLVDVSIQLTKKLWTEKLREQARVAVEEKILDRLTGPSPENRSRESFREMLRDGILDDNEIDVEVPQGGGGGGSSSSSGLGSSNSDLSGGGDGMNPTILSVSDLLKQFSGHGGSKSKQHMEKVKLPVSEAKTILLEFELEKLLENVDLKKEAITAVEESGIVFIDEIDKICSPRDAGSSSRNSDASAEGVQRDLLPIVEGTTISTKHGNVNTDYILFIASGSFHSVKPSDMLPELQGRLPIRVELSALSEEDLYRILTEPIANLVRQQIALIGTEGITLIFDDDAVREIARMSAYLNRVVENIGARRLHTVMEKIMEELSYQAAEIERGSTLTVTKTLVQERLADVKKKSDLTKYIL